MTRVSWADGAKLLLLAAVGLMVTVPTASQVTKIKTITDPDFPCGVPWGPNGERPTETTRTKRQIILPDNPQSSVFPGQLIGRNGTTIDISEHEPVDKGHLEEGKEQLVDAICGAAVISDRFIVTAAHCALDENHPISAVRLGDLDLGSDSEPLSRPADYDIREIIINRDYRGANTRERYNNIALLLTYDTIKFNDVVYPYCVPKDPPPPGTIVTASGYGYFNATTKPTHVLEGNLTIINTKECEDTYFKHGQEANLRLQHPDLLQGSDIICAFDDKSDACEGDSGGPVLWKKDGKEYLAAIVGTGSTCRGNSKSALPGLYVSLAHHLDFINRNVYGNVPPPEP